MRSIGVTAPLQEPGKSEEIQAFDFVCGIGWLGK